MDSLWHLGSDTWMLGGSGPKEQTAHCCNNTCWGPLPPAANLCPWLLLTQTCWRRGMASGPELSYEVYLRYFVWHALIPTQQDFPTLDQLEWLYQILMWFTGPTRYPPALSNLQDSGPWALTFAICPAGTPRAPGINLLAFASPPFWTQFYGPLSGIW